MNLKCYLVVCRIINVLSIIAVLRYLSIVPCILVKRKDKLKKWLFYIYLLITITKALYQSSEKGMSLLFTCPQLTGRIKLTTGCCCKNAAACYAIYFCLVESIPQFLELWPISMHVHGTSNFTLLYRNATSYSIILPCLKLKYFNLPNQELVLHQP